MLNDNNVGALLRWAGLGLIVVFVLLAARVALSQPIDCSVYGMGNYAEAKRTLGDKFGEQVILRAPYSGQGPNQFVQGPPMVLEIWYSETNRTWTTIAVDPNGCVRVLANGDQGLEFFRQVQAPQGKPA